MIKKQLSILAGSVLLASGANAAITNSVGDAGSSVLAVLVGTNGSYVFDAGITADQLSSGIGFSIDTSAATTIGTIVDFAVFGITSGTEGNGGVNGYSDAGFGVVSAGASNGAISDEFGVFSAVSQVRDYFNAVGTGGVQADGSAGDLDEATAASALGLLIDASTTTGISWLQETSGGGADLSAVTGPVASLVGSELSVAAVPVPAAAWLFGSALLGLGVVRRKKS